ncbi:hypothetical protein LCGC14_3023780, partial [marine sediment metagenome]
MLLKQNLRDLNKPYKNRVVTNYLRMPKSTGEWVLSKGVGLLSTADTMSHCQLRYSDKVTSSDGKEVTVH